MYRIYQLLIVLPLGILATILTALATSIGCMVGNAHFWGYYPAMLWGRFICRLLLLPVRVTGREPQLQMDDEKGAPPISSHWLRLPESPPHLR